MSFNSLNTSSHQQQSLAIKREPFDSSGSVAIKLESLEQSPSKHSYPAMHHLGGNGNYCSSPNDLLKCKKRVTNFAKMNYSPSPHTPHQPSVARRNERERNRVKMVNNGFATLRQHVPNGAKNKKMSKVETLRSAVEYIRQLQKLLGPGSSEHSFSLEQFSNSEAANSNSGDENCYPSPMSGHHIEHSSPLESSAADHHQMEHQMNYSSAVSNLYSSMAESMYGLQSPTSSENMSTGKLNNTYSLTSPSERISPTPSVASSDMTSSSSPYDSHALMETNIVSRQQTVAVAHEDELFDFSSWF